ncbi:hypothetical protein RFI_33067 [Reticulomyxa filosa]|uniref:Uncharacterized protein n=1 Tax=Reticulomyxa filosa TaxID=46433 RepID=X6LR31_RETFI|nr:hypothetical protein RFI_33067 [Reticulomyxa filosa]|eukprot:ETO04328.1 hypothetical protein RFI_33067 [Reticulomyxa filosa]
MIIRLIKKKKKDLQVGLVVVGLTLLVLSSLSIFLGFRNFHLNTVVYNRQVYSICKSRDFSFLESLLYVLYGIPFLYIGQSKGAVMKYNDSKWVMLISYNVFVSMVLLIFLDHTAFIDPLNYFFGKGLTLIIVITTNISLYIVPKLFRTELMCVHFLRYLCAKMCSDQQAILSPTSLSPISPNSQLDSPGGSHNWRYLIIDRQNKENLYKDMGLIKEYLGPLGYRIVRETRELTNSQKEGTPIPTKPTPDESIHEIELHRKNSEKTLGSES